MKRKKRLDRAALWRKAIDRADFEKLKLLCKKKGDTEKAFWDLAGSPFNYAITVGNVETVAFLLKCGAKLDDAKFYWSPLMGAVDWASCRGNHDVVRFLLSAGAKVNWRARGSSVPGGVGETALFRAAARGSAELTRMLLDAGADVNAVSRRGGNALTEAVRFRHAAVVEMLIGAGSRAAGAVLCIPCFLGDLPLVRRLITLGADPNVKHDDACFSEHFNERFLLKGETPLGSAARYGETELADILLKAGANPNQISALRTPLAWACMTFDYTEHHLTAVKQLLAAGAEPNVFEGGDRYTPLHWAAERGYADLVVELLKAGANPKLKTTHAGYTPSALATQNNHTAVAALLADAVKKRRQ